MDMDSTTIPTRTSHDPPTRDDLRQGPRVTCFYCKRPGACPPFIDDWGIGHAANCEAPECQREDERDTYRQRVARALNQEMYVIELDDGEYGAKDRA